jgi:hypothetical protein
LRLPPGVHFEVAHRSGYRRPLTVVENDQSAWTNEFAEKVQVDEDIVEAVAAIYERSVGDNAIGQQARERNLGSFGHERAKITQTCGYDRLPTNVLEPILVGVDDHVLCVQLRLPYQGFRNCQRRAAVRQTDFDDHTSARFDKQVAKNIAVLAGESHALEVTLCPEARRPILGQPPARILDGCQKFSIRWHRQIIADRKATRPPRRDY